MPEPAQTNTSSRGEATELAFRAHLIPLPASDDEPAGDRPAPLRIPVGTPSRPRGAVPLSLTMPEASTEVTPVEPSTGQTVGHREGGSRQLPASREKESSAPEHLRKPETAAPPEVPSSSAGKLVPHVSHAPETRPASASNRPESGIAAEPTRPGEVPEPEAASQPKPPAVARDIQLEVRGGERRVEVRLVERGGEVHVAVRTPDAHLASALRENLPALSSRLVETGFRTETWRPAAPSGPEEWKWQAQPSAGGAPHDPNPQSQQDGREQHGDPDPRWPQVPEEQANPKKKGKEFAWFISSLR